MKKILQMAGLCALIIGFVVSCDPNKPQEPETLAVPTGLDVTDITATSATLSWSGVEGAVGYEVRINDGNPVAATGTTHAATGLTPDSEQTWAVRAVKGNIMSEWAEGSFETPVETVGEPTALAVSDLTMTTAKLTWTGAADATGYEVRIGGEDAEPVAVTEPTYDVTDLAPGNEYDWAVRSTRGNVISVWVTGDPFTTGLPVAPAGLNVADTTPWGATLTWEAVEGATGYQVRIGEGDPIDVEGTEYEAFGFSVGTEYSWTVRAVMDEVMGEWAEPAGTFTPAGTVTRFTSTSPFNTFNGDEFGAGTSNFTIQFFTASYLPMLVLDVISEEVDTDPAIRYLSVPEGVYTVAQDPALNTLCLSGGFTMLVGGPGNIESGKMTVRGNNNDYYLMFDFTLAGGQRFFGQWVGPIDIANPNYGGTNWEYASILGAYSATGTPAGRSETPGTPSWTGEVREPAGGSTFKYELTGHFGGFPGASYIDVQDGTLYIDNYSNLGENIEGTHYARMTIAVIRQNGAMDYVTGTQPFIKSLSWDWRARTISYPLERYTLDGEVFLALYGIGAFNKTTDELEGVFSDFYSNLLITLGNGTSASTFSGDRVDVSALKRFELKDTAAEKDAMRKSAVPQERPASFSLR